MNDTLTKEEIWDQLVERYNWEDDQITRLKTSGIKSLIFQAWEEGFKIGQKR